MRLVDVGRNVIVHEAASFAGGRCRSYLDPMLGLVIDNGNHLLLSGNHEALDYLGRIGARETLRDPGAAIFDFADLKSGERWRLDLSEGRIPWWLFDGKMRVPGTALRRIFRAARRVHEGAERDRRRGDELRGRALRAALAPAADLGAQHGSPGKFRRAYRRFAAREFAAGARRATHSLRPMGLPAVSSIRRALFSLRATFRFGSATASGRSVLRRNARLRSTLTGRGKSSARTICDPQRAAMDREGPTSGP